MRLSISPFRGVARHPDHEGCGLVARMWDLASAYRQLARAPAHESFTVVAVWNPAARRHDFFRQLALAFGASASVLSFNWVSKALTAILVEILRAGCTCFYDDFTVVEPTTLAPGADRAIGALFDLLGWDTKNLGSFSEVIEPLGQS